MLSTVLESLVEGRYDTRCEDRPAIDEGGLDDRIDFRAEGRDARDLGEESVNSRLDHTEGVFHSGLNGNVLVDRDDSD